MFSNDTAAGMAGFQVHHQGNNLPVVLSAGVPVMGKGFYPGSAIDLFVGASPAHTKHKPTSSDAAKVSL